MKSTSRPRAVTFITGRYSEQIGGPYRTIGAYRTALHELGYPTCLIALTPEPGARTTDEPRIQFRWWAPASWARLLIAVWRVRDTQFVVFGVWHAPFFVASALGAALPRQARRVLVPTNSLSPHDWGKHRRLKRLLGPVVRAMVHSYDAVICASMGELREATPPLGRRGLVVHEPLEYIRDHNRRFETDSLTVLGRLAPEKDIELALTTLAELSGTHLDVVGSGSASYLEVLRQRAKELGVAERVSWHGWQEHDVALDVVARSSCLLVTSHVENYCRAAVEAMAVGTPVVMVDRVASASDFAQAGAVLTTTADPTSIAEAVRLLQADSALRHSVCVRGRDFARVQMGEGRRRAALALLAATPEGAIELARSDG